MSPQSSATTTATALLLLLLLSVACTARPTLPEDELVPSQEDLEDDLDALEDARAVDEAYQRLFGPPLVDSPSGTRQPSQPATDEFDSEIMQGDQPLPEAAANTSPSSAATADSDQVARNAAREAVESSAVARDRNLRVEVIKGQILELLGLSEREHPIRNSTKETMNVFKNVPAIWPSSPPQDVVTQKLQSHYPSCSVPRNTDEALWSSGRTLHLLFDLPSGPPLTGTSINIMQASLRLFKLGNASHAVSPQCRPTPVGTTTSPPADGDEDATDTVAERDMRDAQAGQASQSEQGRLQALLNTNAPDEREVHVSVYWYTRSLKKNKNGVVTVRRKLLDSRMVPVQGAFWTEWNVRPAARVWRESGRNFGLAVEVEDEDGRQLDARQLFSGMDCTLEASSEKPLPSFLVELLYRRLGAVTRPGTGPAAYAFSPHMFPVIDLRIVETSDDGDGDALYSADYLPSGLGSHSSRRPHLLSQQSQQGQRHRHRHQHARLGDLPEHAGHLHSDRRHDDGVEPMARRWPRVSDDGNQDADQGATVTQRAATGDEDVIGTTLLR